MKSTKEISKYMDELFDKVWYVRSMSHHTPEGLRMSNIPQDIIDGMLKARARIEKEYGTEWYNEMDNWEYGFLSGALATLRWVVDKKEEDKRFLDT